MDKFFPIISYYRFAVLPYVLGITMAGAGVLYCLLHFHSREARVESAPQSWPADAFCWWSGLSAWFMGRNSSVLWGSFGPLFGIRKAAKSLSRTIQEFGSSMVCAASLIEFVVRMTLSILLLLYPMEKFAGQIVLLGLEVIAVSIRPAKRLFQILDGDE